MQNSCPSEGILHLYIPCQNQGKVREFDCKAAASCDTSLHGMVVIMAAALWALLKLSVVILVEILHTV